MVEFSASYLPETAVFTLKVACRRFSTAGGKALDVKVIYNRGFIEGGLVRGGCGFVR